MERLRQLITLLRHPLSRVQTTVALITGLITIGGVILPLVGVMPVQHVHGEVVTVVRDAQSRRPVTNATIEIVTLDDAVITTLFSKEGGRARYLLKEGGYRLRVMHPKFNTQVRQIVIQPGQPAEIHFALAPIPRSQPKAVAAPEKVGAVRRFFQNFGI